MIIVEKPPYKMDSFSHSGERSRAVVVGLYSPLTCSSSCFLSSNISSTSLSPEMSSLSLLLFPEGMLASEMSISVLSHALFCMSESLGTGDSASVAVTSFGFGSSLSSARKTAVSSWSTSLGCSAFLSSLESLVASASLSSWLLPEELEPEWDFMSSVQERWRIVNYLTEISPFKLKKMVCWFIDCNLHI